MFFVNYKVRYVQGRKSGEKNSTHQKIKTLSYSVFSNRRFSSFFLCLHIYTFSFFKSNIFILYVHFSSPPFPLRNKSISLFGLGNIFSTWFYCLMLHSVPLYEYVIHLTGPLLFDIYVISDLFYYKRVNFLTYLH